MHVVIFTLDYSFGKQWNLEKSIGQQSRRDIPVELEGSVALHVSRKIAV